MTSRSKVLLGRVVLLTATVCVLSSFLAAPALAEVSSVAVSGDKLPALFGQSNTLQEVMAFDFGRFGEIAFQGVGSEGAAIWSWTDLNGFDLVAQDESMVDEYEIDLADEDNDWQLFDATGEVLLSTELFNGPTNGERPTLSWMQDAGLRVLLPTDLQLPGFDDPARPSRLSSTSNVPGVSPERTLGTCATAEPAVQP